MKDMPQAQYALDPADELAEIGAEMARLKARAEELRMGFITCGDMPRVGQRHRVEVMVQKAQIFDAKLLPAQIRNDSRFLRTRIMRIVKTIPVDPAGEAIKSALARWEALDTRDAVGAPEALHDPARRDFALH